MGSATRALISGSTARSGRACVSSSATSSSGQPLAPDAPVLDVVLHLVVVGEQPAAVGQGEQEGA